MLRRAAVELTGTKIKYIVKYVSMSVITIGGVKS